VHVIDRPQCALHDGHRSWEGRGVHVIDRRMPATRMRMYAQMSGKAQAPAYEAQLALTAEGRI
jgi:hypothetical protein